ncbi:rhomboid family intramembrane serine protease [Candidatus Methylacidithermus pantelleriae]|uniref:Rhomboid domain-containing protein n=1 Tax=Candidatus Methylacidithermus pantelleriae TaxID=2744239 RepID=A0A8J2FMR6_9BACT|nr:rhomboid family intramembrane serine protease [Candidatus Methylacidithermus pantelleriae]CAF0689657.1 Rhomboid domain-containing protein [Candidatus Methylacidithermus pantelleriae]
MTWVSPPPARFHGALFDHLRRSPVTYFLVASNFSVYLVQLVAIFFFGSVRFRSLFSLSLDGLARGWYWQGLTYAWLHAEFLPFHLFLNVLLIYILGWELESLLGSLRFALLYLGSVLAGAAGWFVADPGDMQGVMGASGAVFGLITGFASLRATERFWVLFPIPVVASARTLAWLLVAFEALCQLFHWMPQVAHSAHLGGAIFGYLFVRLLPLTPPWQVPSYQAQAR